MEETKTKVIEENSIYTYYIIGITWIVFASFFKMISVMDYLILVALSVVEFYLGNKCLKKTTRIIEIEEIVDVGDIEVNALLKLGRKYINEIKTLNGAIHDDFLTKKINEIINLCEKIFQTIAKSPKDMKKINKFMSYYLPTTIKLLNVYVDLIGVDIDSDNINGSKKHIEDSLDMIIKSFTSLLDSLYSDELLDVSTDISVFQNMMAMDGIIDNKIVKENTHE